MASNQDGEKQIREWWGGISDDTREQVYTQFAISKHFDTISYPTRLVPYRSMEADEDTSFKIKDFAYVGGVFYGLGRNAADTKNKIYQKSSEISGTWGASANSEATGATSAIRGFFAPYQGNLYLYQSGTTVAKYIPATSYTDSFGSLGATILTVGGWCVHPIADRLFMAYNNVIAQVDGATFTDEVLVLPDNVAITSMCAWGDSLAIATKPKSSGEGQSRVYLWNMIDATPYEVIDWGEEDLIILENIDSQLVGVSMTRNSSLYLRQTLFGKSWTGGDVVNFKTIDLGSATSSAYTLGITKQLSQNRLYFSLTNSSSSAQFIGIWELGRKNEQYPFQMTVGYLVNNDTATTGANSFYKLGDYMFVAYGTGSVNRTDDTALYTATSYVETQIYDGGDSSRLKKLTGVALTYPVLPAAGQVVLKYRKDEETSYTTIATDTTDNNMANLVTAISTSTSLPSFYQIQFKIEDTGGSDVMELRFKYDVAGSPMD